MVRVEWKEQVLKLHTAAALYMHSRSLKIFVHDSTIDISNSIMANYIAMRT